MKRSITKYIYHLSLAVTVTAGISCNKFLEETDPSNLSPETFYQTPSDAEAGLAAVYAQTRFFSNGAGIFVANYSMLEAMTGTSKTETGQNSDLNNMFGLVFNGDNLMIRNWWNALYSVVAQANLVIQGVPPISPMDEAQKKKIIGEAQFLRAWAYFYLVRLWGDVPLMLTPVTATSPDFYASRTAAETVYNQIVTDLTAAEGSGLPISDPAGRVCMGAVKSLLAKVYLTMAGFPLNKGVSHYTLAAAKAKEVIDSKAFRLFDTYREIHTVANENQGEHIFEIQYLATIASANVFQQTMLPNFKDVSAWSDEMGTTVPVPAFYQSYTTGDLRAKDRQGYFYTSYYTGGQGALKNLGAPYIFKHFDSLAHGSFGVKGTTQSDLNWPQIRYAEVLLIYAEAQNEVSGPNQLAYDGYKAIRDRAQLTTPALGTFSQASFREAIWRERWWELCYEGITWFDMVRLRKVFNESTKNFDAFTSHTFPDNGAKLEEKHYLLPLPTEEMRNNPNLTPNNPGY